MNVPPDKLLKLQGALLVGHVEQLLTKTSLSRCFGSKMSTAKAGLGLLTKTSLSRCFGSKMSTAKAGLGLCSLLAPSLQFHVLIWRHWHNRDTP